MWKTRWLLSVPLVLAATAFPAATRAAEVRDRAGMFSTDAVQKATTDLDRIERENRVPVTIETVPSLEGKSINSVLEEHAQRARARGLYVLISKDDSEIRVQASAQYRGALSSARTKPISDAFVSAFKSRDFDGGLLAGVREIGSQVAEARAGGGFAQAGRRAGPVNRPMNPNGGFGLGSLLGIGLLIVGVLFVVRLLGGLFGGASGARGYPGQPGRMVGPGYGGAGGGGFMSSLFGGIGGALAGNWLYDQFSGRNHGGGYGESSSYNSGSGADTGADDWSGGGGTTGDFGGGDAGGGGDWGGGGGGGGDWGGGGGDGGAGGDW